MAHIGLHSLAGLKHGNGDVTSAISDRTDIDEVEDITEGEDIPLPYEYDITFYGADFPVDSLVKRLNEEKIVVSTFGQYNRDDSQIEGFQRGYVWSRLKSDRFIESLLLGLPVPGIFLVQDKEGHLLVLDGQQRLQTLQRFYGEPGQKPEYRLRNVHPKFQGQSYEDLDPPVSRRLDNSLIHATIIKQDQPTNGQISVYDIFERLNTGGSNLQPQEIRVTLYHGKFANLLLELNEAPDWRFLYGPKSDRLKDLEMILRFFAFYYSGHNYARPMKNFLNRYMGKNRNLEHQSKDDLTEIFCKTVTFIKATAGENAFRPHGALNAAVLDSVMTGIARRIRRGPIQNCQDVKKRLRDLFSNEKYITAIKSGTSEEGKVKMRQQLALDAFASIQ